MRKKRIISLLLVFCLIGFSACKTEAEKQAEEDEELFTNLFLLLTLSSLARASTASPFATCSGSPTLTKGVALTGQTVAFNNWNFYRYTAVASESNTYTVTPTTSDPDLFVFTSNLLVDTNSSTSTIVSSSTNGGASVDSVTLANTNGAFRCIGILGFSNSGPNNYSIIVN